MARARAVLGIEYRIKLMSNPSSVISVSVSVTLAINSVPINKLAKAKLETDRSALRARNRLNTKFVVLN